MEQKFKKLFDRFYSIQCEKYFEHAGKDVFDTSDEEESILKTIRNGWNKYIESKKENLLHMKERDIDNFFDAVDIDFPRFKHIKNDDIDFDEDDFLGEDDLEDGSRIFDGDDEDDDIDREMELLNEELNKLSDELESIPEEDREDVVMLMLAFPALQEIGFPVEVFMSGDGSTHLTDMQRQQIDWARQLAYKIVDMAEEPDPKQKATMHKEITQFAAAFVSSSNIEKVVREIQTAYERGKNMG